VIKMETGTWEGVRFILSPKPFAQTPPLTDQLDVKKCIDDIIQRLRVPDEPPKYVLSPLQVDLFKKHLRVSDAWIAAHVHVMDMTPTPPPPDFLKAATHKYLHRQELQRLNKR